MGLAMGRRFENSLTTSSKTRAFLSLSDPSLCPLSLPLSVCAPLSAPSLCHPFSASLSAPLSLSTKIINLSKVSMFVLDEADIMIDSKEGLGKTIQEIKRALPRGCQKLLFSATFEPAMRKFAEKFVGQPCHAVYEKNMIERLKQYWIQAGERPDEKQNVLNMIYDTMKLQVRACTVSFLYHYTQSATSLTKCILFKSALILECLSL